MFGFGTAIVAGRKMIRTLQDMTKESVDFVETVNLFNVSFGKGLEGLNQYYEKAIKFQNELEEKLGVNIKESMNYQALFNSMSKSMGISAKYAYTLSENFTKLGYDLASLYNIDPTNAMQKLRAGLAGQTKPLRDLGLDITQQSLQPIVDSLGIDKSIKNMSQAEKMVLRYIAVLKQAQIAQGDFANTMESPANQLRIFNAQVIAFKRNMGNLWQGFLGGILPYINAVMMVINELLKMVAKLFGFKISDQPINISANVGANDLAEDLGTAGKKAKELKAQLMGFDEINNISLQTDSGSGSGSSSVGGIDQRLLNAMSEYDNLMDKVKSKATDVRDKIMQWLGFTKKVNPLTGEISWEYTGMSKQAKTILGILKAITLLYIGTKALKLVGYLKNLKGVISGTIKPTTNFQNGLALLSNGIKDTGAWLKLGVEQFKLYRKAGDNVTTSLGKTGKGMLDLIPNTVKVAGGIAGLVSSSVLAYNSMKDLSNGTIDSREAMLKLTGSIAGATASGALIGSVFGPAGAVIGGLTGLVIDGVSAFIGYKDETDRFCESVEKENEKIHKNIDAIREQKQAVEDSINSQIAQIDYVDNLVKELDTLVDSNGKVKTGYEDRVNFILNQLKEATGEEWKLTNGTIEKYQDLKKEINNLIDAKKAEIILNANQEEYAKAIGRQIQLQHDKKTTQEELTSVTETYNKKLDEIIKKYGSVNEARKIRSSSGGESWFAIKDIEDLEQLEETMNHTKEEYENVTKAISEDNQLIIAWEDLKTATITGNTNEINKKVQEITNTYKTEAGNQVGTLTEQLAKETDLAKERQKVWEENGIEINETRRQQLEVGIKTLADKLVEQTNTVEELSDEQKEAWKELGNSSYEIYKEELNKLSPELRLEIEKATGIIIEKTPEVEKVSEELSSVIINSLDNSAETRKKAVEAIKSYIGGLSENDQRQLLKQCGINNADEVVKGLKEGNLSEDVGINIIKGLQKGLKNNYWQGQTINTAFIFATNVLERFKKTFGIQSPSKKTKQFGIFLLKGLGIGIDKETPGVLKTVSDFSSKILDKLNISSNSLTKGVQINSKDFSVDTNQFIDYGKITGSIETQNKVDISSDISQQVYQAVVKGMENSRIQVGIEVEADKDGIFKNVQAQAKEFIMQTGEEPFPSPA